ncbi:hypothetical protein R6Q57_011199 [Mikania cordata]
MDSNAHASNQEIGSRIKPPVLKNVADFKHCRPVDLNSVTDEEDRRKIRLCIKAYSSLTMGLPIEILMFVQQFETAKSIWDALGVMFEGSSELKETRKDKPKYQFETFSHISGENV